jgi:proteasome accessory factor C
VPRLSADDRLRRLLAFVPWVAAEEGPTVDEVCRRFNLTEAELAADLELLFVCGLYPYTPDVLIEADIADGRVWVRYADYFARPLRLTPAEGLALVAAGATLLAVPGTDPDGPLARGLRKVAAALGVPADEAFDVRLAPAPADVLAVLREAAEGHRQVELDYYAFGRDEWTRRTVDPYGVFSAGGQWYLSAYCHVVDDERLFRVDRVREARLLATAFDPPDDRPDLLAVYQPRPDDPRVVLVLEPAARWVVEQYPVEEADELGDGRVRVRLVASERAWFERLLLRLGPQARVEEGDADAGRAAACRLLARYRR